MSPLSRLQCHCWGGGGDSSCITFNPVRVAALGRCRKTLVVACLAGMVEGSFGVLFINVGGLMVAWLKALTSRADRCLWVVFTDPLYAPPLF